jgi:hypothetical protein
MFVIKLKFVLQDQTYRKGQTRPCEIEWRVGDFINNPRPAERGEEVEKDEGTPLKISWSLSSACKAKSSSKKAKQQRKFTQLAPPPLYLMSHHDF